MNGPYVLSTGYQTCTHSFSQFAKQSIVESRNLTRCSEQSWKTEAELRGNQMENDLEIQGDQMVALLGVEAPGLGGMKAWSVLGLTGQVRRDTQRKREHSGLEEHSHRQPNPRGSFHPPASAYHCNNLSSNSYSEQGDSQVTQRWWDHSESLQAGRSFHVIIVLTRSLQRWQAFKWMA